MPAVITLPVMLMWVSTEEHYFQKGASLIKELRRKRIVAHRYFDSIWKHGILNRKNAYFWLQDIFGLTSDQAHIGQFSDYMCDQVISASKRVLENNKIAC